MSGAVQVNGGQPRSDSMYKVEDQSELSPAPSELDVIDALAARS